MTLALRRLPTGQREAIAPTLFLDLSPGQAAAATRVSLAALRRRLAEAGQRYGPVDHGDRGGGRAVNRRCQP